MTNIEERIDKLRKLCDGATEGPWRYEYLEPYCSEIVSPERRRIPGISVWLDDAPVPDYNAEVDRNAKFIAQSRTAMPVLLDCLEIAFQAMQRSMKYPALNESHYLTKTSLKEIEAKLGEIEGDDDSSRSI